MTTIDIHDWKGIEFAKEFVDFTVTGMLEAKATGSVRTGRMVRSVKMRKIADGFSLYADRNDYPPTKRGKERYYVNTYMFKGYRYNPAFPFIFTAFDTVGDSENLVDQGEKVQEQLITLPRTQLQEEIICMHREVRAQLRYQGD